MTVVNVIPILMLDFLLKLHCFAPTASTASDVKSDVRQWKATLRNGVGFRQYITEYTVANFRRHPIRRRVIFTSTLEYRTMANEAFWCNIPPDSVRTILNSLTSWYTSIQCIYIQIWYFIVFYISFPNVLIRNSSAGIWGWSSSVIRYVWN